MGIRVLRFIAHLLEYGGTALFVVFLLATLVLLADSLPFVTIDSRFVQYIERKMRPRIGSFNVQPILIPVIGIGMAVIGIFALSATTAFGSRNLQTPPVAPVASPMYTPSHHPPTPTPTPTTTARPSPSVSTTPTPTPSPTASATPSVSPSPTVSVTPTISATPLVSPSPTTEPTIAVTLTPTGSPTPEATSSPGVHG